MIYLDTSAAIPLFVPEPASDAVDAWLESCDDTLISSDWILTEFASALSIKVRRGEIEQKQAQAAWKDFENFCREHGVHILERTVMHEGRIVNFLPNLLGNLAVYRFEQQP